MDHWKTEIHLQETKMGPLEVSIWAVDMVWARFGPPGDRNGPWRRTRACMELKRASRGASLVVLSCNDCDLFYFIYLQSGFLHRASTVFRLKPPKFSERPWRPKWVHWP